MKKYVVLSGLLFGLSAMVHAETYPNSDTQVVHKGLENAHEAIEPAFRQYIKDMGGPQPRERLFKAPVVPHSIRGMQISKNANRCLECHGPEGAKITGATPLSQTHFYDRNDKLLTKPSARRHFCLQCHVPQTDAPLITESLSHVDQRLLAGEKMPLPQVTKTRAFAEMAKKTAEIYKHFSEPYLHNAHH